MRLSGQSLGFDPWFNLRPSEMTSLADVVSTRQDLWDRWESSEDFDDWAPIRPRVVGRYSHTIDPKPKLPGFRFISETEMFERDLISLYAFAGIINQPPSKVERLMETARKKPAVMGYRMVSTEKFIPTRDVLYDRIDMEIWYAERTKKTKEVQDSPDD